MADVMVSSKTPRPPVFVPIPLPPRGSLGAWFPHSCLYFRTRFSIVGDQTTPEILGIPTKGSSYCRIQSYV
ncbi:hypothetical protein J5N97_007689 [Dioscorea zingiberensis]|uniref:Uncharacterized protein n=1 Tax=Dioscorea zingiberensis TaxID=325984 RepID=A0A9D5DDZ3_9LILI|nr:hypothetical protein J5N97_007689 [Dioscorea zingiberensis]